MDADPKESSEENAESTANNGELPSQQSEGANGFTSNSSSVSNSTGSAAKEDNPFSFRHFLSRSQNVHPHSNSQPEMQNRMLDEEFEANRVGGARPKTTKTRANNARHSRIDSLDLKSPCLPDFVQDHVRVEHDLTSAINHSDNGFQNRVAPDHGLFSSHEAENPLDLPRSHSPIHAAGAMPIPLDIANLASSHMVEDDVDIGPLDLANLNSSSIHGDLPSQMEEPALPGLAQAHEINNNENVNSLSQLPDFLSDGPMQQQSAAGRMNPNQQQESAMMDQPDSGVQQPPSPHHHHGSMSMLIEENARLRHQLEMASANERVASTRIERLESLLDEHRRRETEETTTLEQSMEQIENNLKSATQRAVHAESQIAQLKKENRRLQEEVQSLQEAIRLQYSETSPGPNVRGLNRTAQELHQAANSAERSIRDLLAGVEHLRVVAATIESMERIEEVRPKRERDK